ncbi:MAG: T9SS type B sorting domain-containing protein [Bacteroidetes bacterium]|nr:T9SS type B sorting domain-containing protein [Bacteroidota bacterium]
MQIKGKYTSIRWQDDYKQSCRMATHFGPYQVYVKNGACLVKDSILFYKYPFPAFQFIQLDTPCISRDQPAHILLFHQQPLIASWNGTEETDTVVLNNKRQNHVRIKSIYGCIEEHYFTPLDSCSIMPYIPNAFSPNGDALNDIFFIQGEGIQRGEYWIYNRWGELVFHSLISEPWDGTQNGLPVPDGVYLVKVKLESYTYSDGSRNRNENKSTLHLMR